MSKNKHGTVGPAAIQKLTDHALAVAFSDSHVRLDAQQVKHAIETDMATNGFPVTAKQIDDLIMGDDEGDIPEHLRLAFPAFYHVIKKNFE